MKLRKHGLFGVASFEAAHDPAYCFVWWAQDGEPCALCDYSDDRHLAPFTKDQVAERAKSQIGRNGVRVATVRVSDLKPLEDDEN